MTTKPSHALSMRDRLSHLSPVEAQKLLGPGGRQLLMRGATLEPTPGNDVVIDDHEARIRWADARRGPLSRIFFDPFVRGRLRTECSACSEACEHVAGLLSLLLERKTDLGLAMPPPDAAHAADEAELVAKALEERAKRAQSERMKIRSTDPSAPWTDYAVESAVSSKTYRVALRGEERGVSYCTCPDFKTNTLGTCKHVMKVLARTHATFPKALQIGRLVQRERKVSTAAHRWG